MVECRVRASNEWTITNLVQSMGELHEVASFLKREMKEFISEAKQYMKPLL
jgi:hypothetical protein